MTNKGFTAWQLSLLSAMMIVALNNSLLISELHSRLNVLSIQGAGFVLLITMISLFTLCFLFLVLGAGRLLKPVIIAFILISAAAGYFTNQLGVFFDGEMIRNIADTARDGNSTEAMELISGPFISHLLIFGILPSIAVGFARLRHNRPLLELRNRSLFLIFGALMLVSTGLANFKYTTYFSVENRDLRYLAIPVFPILSAARFIKSEFRQSPVFHPVGEDAEQHNPDEGRTVGIMVVGETARADHFSLDGYLRNTNPLLSKEKGLAFYDINSCGTSTAYSVPCIFSMRGHDTYSPLQASSESNVLDILTSVGVKTVWIDNNSSCKNVCAHCRHHGSR